MTDFGHLGPAMMDRTAIIFPRWLQVPYSDALQAVIIEV